MTCKKMFFAASLLVTLMGLSGCKAKIPELTEVVMHNAESIIEKSLSANKNAAMQFKELDKNKKDGDFEELKIHLSKTAERKLPEFMVFGLNPNSAPEGLQLDHLKQSWLFYPGFTVENELASFSLTYNIDYTQDTKKRAFSSFRDLVKMVSEEYGDTEYSQYTELSSIDMITDKNYLRLYNCDTYYLAHYATNDNDHNYISNVLLYISKEYPHYSSNKIYALIDGLENDISQAGLYLDIKKQVILADDRLVEFKPVKPLDKDSFIDNSSVPNYIESLFNQSNFSDDDKNLFLMMMPATEYKEPPNLAIERGDDL